MLTKLDKLLLVLFTVFTIIGGIAGGLLLFVYADPLLPADLDQLDSHKNVSILGGALAITGMLLGYAAALIVFGFLSRRFVPASAHRRWAEFLDPDSFGFQRYPGIAKLLRVALIPRQHRLSSDISQCR
jgi:MFS family permease